MRVVAPKMSEIIGQNVIIDSRPGADGNIGTELAVLGKAHPGKLTYASAGNGSNLHMAAELFNNLSGTKMLHVIYKGGGPALVAVLSGEVDLSYLNIAAVMSYAKSGRLRALGITSEKRSPLMPDVPTIAESGARGYEFTSWAAALVPAGSPRNVVTALYEAFAKALHSPDAEKRFAEQGTVIVASPPDEFARFFKAELAKWARVVKETGIKAD
jgi:tripartite-type tricarboxylate transporter receptor subunit TctC